MPEQLTPETAWLAYVVIVWALCALIVLVPATITLFTYARMSPDELRHREWRRRQGNLRR